MEKTSPHGRVALVGRRLEHNDHLGIAYLEAALAASALDCRVHVLNHMRDVTPVALATLEEQPDVVGLSLQDGSSSVLALALGELLRRKGYRGHITAGGPFATLARAWLLDRYAWLDSVVRFAGEAPLVALARALIAGSSITSVAGLSTRAGDGPPAEVLNPLPLQLSPVRHDNMRILGHKAAHLSATRGCAGRCSYCGPAALQAAELDEGLAAGHPRSELTAAGVGGTRRRSIADIAAEMDRLVRAGYRYLGFVDEHMLPYREADALAWLSELRSRLRAARTPPFATSCMVRAEQLTESIVRELRQLGLARCYVGVEFPSEEQGRLFRRGSEPEHALAMLRKLDACGVATISNLMVVHPYSTASTIEEGLRFLDRIEQGLFEATYMRVYHGTALHRRLEAEGRLFGNPLRWDYLLADPVAHRFAELSVRIRLQILGNHSLVQRLNELHTEIAVGCRLGMTTVTGDADNALDDLRARLNRFCSTALHEALAVARCPPDRRQTDDLLSRLAERAARFDAEIRQLELDFHRALGGTQRRFSPVVAVAASSLFFLFASASPGCAEHGTSSSKDAAAGADDAVVIKTDIAPPSSPSCTNEQSRAAADRVAAAVPCFSGYLTGNSATFYLPTLGLTDIRACDDATAARFSALEEAATAALQPTDCSLYTTTADTQNYAALSYAADTCNVGRWGNNFAIVLDDNGAVVDVRAMGIDGGSDAEALACILATLKGLTFPCLANTQLCPEMIVMDAP